MIKIFSYDDPIERPEQILERKLTMHISKKNAIGNMLFKNSKDPVMRRVYQEATLDRNGLYDYSSGDVPEAVKQNILDGKGVGYRFGTSKAIDGDDFYYSTTSLYFSYTHLPLPKNSWLQVCYGSATLPFSNNHISFRSQLTQ